MVWLGRGARAAASIAWLCGSVAYGPSAEAQEAPLVGTLSGRVIDGTSRAPLGGAAVEVLGFGRSGTSANDGSFRLDDMPVGAHRVEVRLIGYRPTVRTDVIVRSGRLTAIEVALERAPFELEAVTVRPSYFPEPTLEPTSQTAFSAEEIRRAPGSAGDVSRIVMSLPSIAKVNDQSNGLIVRGGSPMENAFLVDGIAIPNINHFPLQGTSGGPIGVLNVDLIRDARLHTGGFPAEFGNRLSSVMEIDLREGNREEIDAQFDLGLAGFGGVVEGPLPEVRGSWVASARRSYLDLVVKAFDVGATVAPRYGDYQGKLTVDLSPAHKVAALVVWSDDHMLTDLQQARDNAMLYFGRQDALTGTTGATWWALWSERLHATTSVSFSLQDFDEDDYETATDQLLLRNHSRERSVTVRNENALVMGRSGELRFGAEGSWVWAEYDNLYGAHVGPLGDTVPELRVAESPRGARSSANVSVALRPLRSLGLTAGVRAEHFSLTGNATLSPRVAGAYRLGHNTTLTASLGVYRQHLPLVLLAQNIAHRSLPDPTATHAVAGVTHLLGPATRLTIEAYHKDYRRLPLDPSQPALLPIDEVFYDYGIFTARRELVAEGRARASGIELVLQKKFVDGVYGLVSGGYSRSRYRGLDGVWRDRVFDNRYVFALEGGYKPSGTWELSARWLLAGGAPHTPIDTAASRALGRTVFDALRAGGARYPAYHSLNVRVDRRFHWRRANLIVYLSVWNAYGRKNVAAYYWNTADERVATIRQWGMLPLLGVELEL